MKPLSLGKMPVARASGKQKILVIGSGFGGLATAIRLQAACHPVTLLEARERPGGRASQLRTQGFTFDMGPTLITAPHLLEDLWQVAGRNLRDDVSMIPLCPFYRIIFHDGRSFDYWGTAEADEAEIARFEPRDVAGYRAFLAATQGIYERAFVDLAKQPFLHGSDFLRVLPELFHLGAQQSVYSFVSRYFRDPHLRMVFSFHPLFIGGNPFRASAIYSIVPYLERLGGVHFAQGGMYTLIEAMERLFQALGGEIRYATPVERIELAQRQVSGVRLADGTSLPAQIIIANSDIATTYLKLLPEEEQSRIHSWRLTHARYSMSCFLLYLGLKRNFPQLRHHTIFMPHHYRQHVQRIFDGHGMPQDMALYLQAPAHTDPQLAPAGGESLYVLAPVPNLAHGIDWQHEAAALRKRILHYLEQEAGLKGLSESIVTEQSFTPLDFASQLRSHLGAAFSLEPTLFQSAYLRPHNRAKEIGGLYFVGAGTHPGAGIPGVLLSAEITSQLVLRDLAMASR
ncbi:phytoene desaturase [Ktedonosporobacter rubrisoli]|uniref:Phytoene dehydrogenase n=1 Tax=Ktedonosporobacter rubrisoli TaxID=2509675 RepID=A0A4P6JQ42_KTERU|nr:phytoene desaturase family protein [Ktedonosporobacter rubrisoli]QBD77363.1 phytoene desaturase [Ktedonosporobacter rubrisoli]